MKTQKKNNFVGTNVRTLILIVSMLVTAAAQAETPKLLYVLSDIYAEPTIIQTYNVRSTGKVDLNRQYRIPYYGIGAVGLAIDSDSQHLFVTYEDSSVIQIIDATTMASKGTFTIEDPDSKNLAGIVYDHDKRLLYCVRRNKCTLFVFDWNPATATLTPVPGSPFSLKGAKAYGIALDEVNDLLYVASHNRTVRIYNTSDWSEAGTIELTFVAVSIALDVAGGYVYTGGGYTGNLYLTQYDLTTGVEKEERIEDGGVMGLCVDQTTGYVYMSTGLDGVKGGDDLLVYDASLKRIDIESDIGNPTGLVIPYPCRNHFNLAKTVVGGIVEEFGGLKYVYVGGNITYDISFNSNNLSHSADDVAIVDTLPAEVSFVSADGDGIFGKYDAGTHKYTWTYSQLPPKLSASLKLVVKVKEDVRPGKKITNVATISSSEISPTTTSSYVITRELDYDTLYVSVDIEGGFPGDSMCVNAGEIISYQICFDNKNDYPVNKVLIDDILPEQVSFVTADGDEDFGYYDPVKHKYEWFYNSLPPKSHNCLELQVQVDPNIAPLTKITNSVSIVCNETQKNTANFDVTICEGDEVVPLETDMCIIPQVIGPRTIAKYVLAVVAIPDGFDPNDVGYDMLILSPGDIEAVDQYVDTESCSGVSLVAAFDKTDILNAATHYGEVTLRVAGTLKTGQIFYAETTAYLTEVGPFIWRWPDNCCP